LAVAILSGRLIKGEKTDFELLEKNFSAAK